MEHQIVQLRLHTDMHNVPGNEVADLITDLTTVLRGFTDESEAPYVAAVKAGSVVTEIAASPERCSLLSQTQTRLEHGQSPLGFKQSQVRALQRIEALGNRRGGATLTISQQK